MVRRARDRAGLHTQQRLMVELGSNASSPRCAASPSTAATTPPTLLRKPPSQAICGGATGIATPNGTSQSTPRSADPITYPTLRDTALAVNIYSPKFRSETFVISSPKTARHFNNRCILDTLHDGDQCRFIQGRTDIFSTYQDDVALVNIALNEPSILRFGERHSCRIVKLLFGTQ